MWSLLATGSQDIGDAAVPVYPVGVSATAGVGIAQGARQDHLFRLVRGRHLHAPHPPHLPLGTPSTPAQLLTTPPPETHHSVSPTHYPFLSFFHFPLSCFMQHFVDCTHLLHRQCKYDITTNNRTVLLKYTTLSGWV